VKLALCTLAKPLSFGLSARAKPAGYAAALPPFLGPVPCSDRKAPGPAHGAKPGDIPIYQATRFKLTLDLSAAKAIGLTFSPSTLGNSECRQAYSPPL
jgi:hypothetical protein